MLVIVLNESVEYFTPTYTRTFSRLARCSTSFTPIYAKNFTYFQAKETVWTQQNCSFLLHSGNGSWTLEILFEKYKNLEALGYIVLRILRNFWNVCMSGLGDGGYFGCFSYPVKTKVAKISRTNERGMILRYTHPLYLVQVYAEYRHMGFTVWHFLHERIYTLKHSSSV